jgi:hypothetical protein
VNVTDPDSRSIPIGFGFVQDYNAQAAVNEQQIVLAAEITNSSTDFSQLDPPVTATLQELGRAGIEQRPQGGGRRCRLLERAAHGRGGRPQAHPRADTARQGRPRTPRPGWTGGRYAWMRALLATEHGRQLYRKCKQTVEPLFGNTKHNNGVYRFHRRDRVKVPSEWRLLMTTHNLTKIHRHQLAAVGA